MKTRKPPLKRLGLLASLLLHCASNLPAQTAPTITTQPISQTNLVGSNVTFTVAVSGTGPFTYQWHFNGTNLPSIITTVAGNGTHNTYAGDGGAAVNASLYYPEGVAFDASGNLYIADQVNNRIRKVDTNGTITTVAGNGSPGHSGDGGAATNAQLHQPFGVTFDTAGNLYIADTWNNLIRKVDTNRIITTVAGNGGSRYFGDGGAATNASLYNPRGVALDAAGNLYIADTENNRIRKVDINGIITTEAGDGPSYPSSGTYSGDGGAATNASLYSARAVVLDAAGNLYIADEENNRIRKVDTNGIITTVAGNGNDGYSGDGGAATNASLYSPAGVALDAAGNLYIADIYNQRIRMVDTNGIITTVAGNGNDGYSGDGGAATNARLNFATAVALDAFGNLYIADDDNNCIREVALAAYPTLTLTNVSAINAGNYTVIVTSPYGSVTSAIAALTVPAPPVITVQPPSQIVGVGSNAVFSAAVAGSGPFGYWWYMAGTNLIQSGTNSTLTLPGVSTNNAGNYTVVITNAFGSVTSLVATLTVVFPPSLTAQSGGQTVPVGTNVGFSVTVGGTGPFSYQWQFNGANLPNNIMTTVAGNGSATNTGDGGAATNASLYDPRGVAFDAAGNLYIADQNNNRIRKVDTNGVITTVAGNGTNGYSGDGGAATNASLSWPTSVSLDAACNLYISDLLNGRVRKVATSGVITTVAKFTQPVGVALDATGNLYVADQAMNAIYSVNTNGAVMQVAGGGLGNSGQPSAAIDFPQGLAFDATGNLYIADTDLQLIYKVATNGIISTVAGNGSQGYSGGGAATNSRLNYPQGVALDAAGNLYVADTDNERIRKVGTNGIVNTVAGNGSTNFSGDGGAATNASLNWPASVALDAVGNLYIADYDNNRIREVHFAGLPTLALTNVSANNAGSYAVVVTSPYGTVTSAVATLTVQAPPVITVQPANQTVLAGSSTTFSVAVAGSGPFRYFWYFAGTNLLQSGTNSTLTLPRVLTNAAGNYKVVVENAYGGVPSAVATLTVIIPTTPPQILASDACFGFLTNQFGFDLSGAFGQTIVVDGSSDLVNWTPLFTNMVSGNPFYFCDLCWTNFPARFYRARLQ